MDNQSTQNKQSLISSPYHVFYAGMQFYSRGGAEHRRLRIDKIKREETRYVYYENGSKNCKCTFLKETYIGNKVVESVTEPEAGKRCHVHLLDIYICKLLPDAHMQGWCFLLLALTKYTIHKAMVLSSTNRKEYFGQDGVRCVCKGRPQNKNQPFSPCYSTSATTLIKANVSEEEIQERTEHCSVDAWR